MKAINLAKSYVIHGICVGLALSAVASGLAAYNSVSVFLTILFSMGSFFSGYGLFSFLNDMRLINYLEQDSEGINKLLGR